MREISIWQAGRKRRMYFVLFLALCLLFVGCVKPVTGPETTNTPAPTATGEVKPTKTPAPAKTTPTPAVTEPIAEPTAVPEVKPTDEPKVTEVPNITPAVTTEPTPTTGPEGGDGTEVPGVTPEPTPVPVVTAVPLPTPVPEYGTLLENGWQRTEDFFGRREIFFSGIFDLGEAITGEESYEFCYRSASDESVLFRVIGEEGSSAEAFLDELRQNQPDCLIEQEGTEDYSYVYIDGQNRIEGRVYDCGNGEAVNRMRVEFYSPAHSDIQTEGYGFYLR